MNSPRFSLLAALLALALFAMSCSSGSDSTVVADGDTTTSSSTTDTDSAASDTETESVDSDGDTVTGDEATTDDTSDDTLTADDPAGTSATDDGSGGDASTPVDAGDVDLTANASVMVRNLFNIDPSPADVECILGEADSDPTLKQAIIDNNPVFAEFGDEVLASVTTGMNGCVNPTGLGMWATEAVAPEGPIRETAPECFGNGFSDPDQGDALFQTFVALSFQYRYEQDMVDPMARLLAECTPITSLVDFFAGGREQQSGFTVDVDRDCLTDALADPATSVAFWTSFIDIGIPPQDIVDPAINGCAAAPLDDFDASIPADFVAWSGTGALSTVSPPSRLNVYSAPPPLNIDPSSEYEAVFATGGGEIRIRLFVESAPVTVNNFVNLARDGFYDGTVFHRVLDDFMAQGGDPTGTGTGGPGYQFEDETEGGPALDRPGLLAMANSGPNTNGSQFFITFVATEWLTGNHTVFGEVTEGIELVNAIQRRDPAAPSGRGQVLESVTIIES